MLACGDKDDSSTRCDAIVIFVVSDTLNIKLSSMMKRMLGNAVEITSYNLYLIICISIYFRMVLSKICILGSQPSKLKKQNKNNIFIN